MKYFVLFHRILYDENASCHLALGQCLRYCIKDGESMTDEEHLAAGCNISDIHVDFIIGSEEMRVDGILENGEIEAILRDGEWVFEV